MTAHNGAVMQHVTRTPSQIYVTRLRSFLLLYFLQGLPYGIQTRFLPVQLRKAGMSLTNLGYFRMILAPWVLKGLWAPIIDSTGDLRSFLSGSHVALVVLSFLAANFTPEHIIFLGIILFLIHLSVAVQDIALDGLLIELLSPSQLVAGNMVQVIGYKLGSIVSGGFFGFLTDIAGWDTLFYIVAFLYAAGYFIAVFGIPTDNVQAETASFHISVPISNSVSSIIGFDDTNSTPLEFNIGHRDREPRHSIYHIVDVDGTMWLLPFVFVYKFGDQGVSTMFPMFMIDAGLDVAQVTFWCGCVGQVFSLLGSVLGGILRKTMIESIKILLVAQAVCLLILWAAVIFWNNSEVYYASLVVLMMANLASGGVTTCTFTLIMQLSQKVPRRYRTSHYTLLATSEVAGRLLAGSVTGILTDNTSYFFTFGLLCVTSVLTLPLLLIVPGALIIEA